MFILQEFGPLLGAMAALACCSAFFSCSEAALFSLQMDDRRILKHGNTAQQVAVELLTRTERLLTAILFWNLIINIVYFALASVVTIRLESFSRRTEAGLFAFFALLVIIFLSEMFPKTIGVIQPRAVASLVSIPLAVSVRMLDPAIPFLGAISRALQRLLLPGFRAETYLELGDLERAISLSTEDKQLVAQEHRALQNILSLSELTAEELMRPRTQYQSFRPPVHLQDLGGRVTRSGYLLVTETDSDEVEPTLCFLGWRARKTTLPIPPEATYRDLAQIEARSKGQCRCQRKPGPTGTARPVDGPVRLPILPECAPLSPPGTLTTPHQALPQS